MKSNFKFQATAFLSVFILCSCTSASKPSDRSDQQVLNDVHWDAQKKNAVQTGQVSGGGTASHAVYAGMTLALVAVTTPFPSASRQRSEVWGKCVFSSSEVNEGKCQGVYVTVEDVGENSKSQVWIDKQTSEFSFLFVPGHTYRVTAFDENYGIKSETMAISKPTSLMLKLVAN